MDSTISASGKMASGMGKVYGPIEEEIVIMVTGAKAEDKAMEYTSQQGQKGPNKGDSTMEILKTSKKTDGEEKSYLITILTKAVFRTVFPKAKVYTPGLTAQNTKVNSVTVSDQAKASFLPSTASPTTANSSIKKPKVSARYLCQMETDIKAILKMVRKMEEEYCRSMKSEC